MGEHTNIQWYDHTFNPWGGCTKVSTSESAWRDPPKWDRAAKAAGERHRVFCASLADVFEDRPELVAPRVRLFHLIGETPNLTWLLLTKRPENIRRFYGDADTPRSWTESPPPNIWAGTSVENQATADERIPHLLRCPATVRFLSCEPLLGPVEFSDVGRRSDVVRVLGRRALSGIGWIIVGGESGNDTGKYLARSCDLAWIRSIVKQCRAVDVPVWVKQLGSRPYDSFYRSGVADQRLYLKDRHGEDWDEWGADLRVRQMPEVARA